ncbi:hypothetical protein HK096_009414, partial [Nowakowskiella sp. JEL0078]
MSSEVSNSSPNSYNGLLSEGDNENIRGSSPRLNLSNLIQENSTSNKWTPFEDSRLMETVSRVGQQWELVSSGFPGIKSTECFSRYKFLAGEMDKESWEDSNHIETNFELKERKQQKQSQNFKYASSPIQSFSNPEFALQELYIQNLSNSVNSNMANLTSNELQGENDIIKSNIASNLKPVYRSTSLPIRNQQFSKERKKIASQNDIKLKTLNTSVQPSHFPNESKFVSMIPYEISIPPTYQTNNKENIENLGQNTKTPPTTTKRQSYQRIAPNTLTPKIDFSELESHNILDLTKKNKKKSFGHGYSSMLGKFSTNSIEKYSKSNEAPNMNGLDLNNFFSQNLGTLETETSNLMSKFIASSIDIDFANFNQPENPHHGFFEQLQSTADLIWTNDNPVSVATNQLLDDNNFLKNSEPLKPSESTLKFESMTVKKEDDLSIPRNELDQLFAEHLKTASEEEIRQLNPSQSKPDFLFDVGGSFTSQQILKLRVQSHQTFQLLLQTYTISREVYGDDSNESKFWNNELIILEKLSDIPHSLISKENNGINMITSTKKIQIDNQSSASKKFVREYNNPKKVRSQSLHNPSLSESLEEVIKICQSEERLTPRITKVVKPSKKPFFTNLEDELMLLGLRYFGFNQAQCIQAHCLPGKKSSQISRRLRTAIESNRPTKSEIKTFFLTPFKPLTLLEKDLMRVGIKSLGSDFRPICVSIFNMHPRSLLKAEWNKMYKSGEVNHGFYAKTRNEMVDANKFVTVNDVNKAKSKQQTHRMEARPNSKDWNFEDFSDYYDDSAFEIDSSMDLASLNLPSKPELNFWDSENESNYGRSMRDPDSDFDDLPFPNLEPLSRFNMTNIVTSKEHRERNHLGKVHNDLSSSPAPSTPTSKQKISILNEIYLLKGIRYESGYNYDEKEKENFTKKSKKSLKKEADRKIRQSRGLLPPMMSNQSFELQTIPAPKASNQSSKPKKPQYKTRSFQIYVPKDEDQLNDQRLKKSIKKPDFETNTPRSDFDDIPSSPTPRSGELSLPLSEDSKPLPNFHFSSSTQQARTPVRTPKGNFSTPTNHHVQTSKPQSQPIPNFHGSPAYFQATPLIFPVPIPPNSSNIHIEAASMYARLGNALSLLENANSTECRDAANTLIQNTTKFIQNIELAAAALARANLVAEATFVPQVATNPIQSGSEGQTTSVSNK